jgi:hypothetical protein
LNGWFGKDNWRLDGSDFSECWDMEQFGEKVEVEVKDDNNEKIGKVRITSEFTIEDNGYGRCIVPEPKSIELIETNDKLKQIIIERQNAKKV